MKVHKKWQDELDKKIKFDFVEINKPIVFSDCSPGSSTVADRKRSNTARRLLPISTAIVRALSLSTAIVSALPLSTAIVPALPPSTPMVRALSLSTAMVRALPPSMVGARVRCRSNQCRRCYSGAL